MVSNLLSNVVEKTTTYPVTQQTIQNEFIGKEFSNGLSGPNLGPYSLIPSINGVLNPVLANLGHTVYFQNELSKIPKNKYGKIDEDLKLIYDSSYKKIPYDFLKPSYPELDRKSVV